MVNHPRRLSYDEALDLSNNLSEHTPLVSPSHRQRRGLRRAPIKILQFIFSGIKKSAKLVRGNRQRNYRNRSRLPAVARSTNVPSGESRRSSELQSRIGAQSMSSRTIHSFEQGIMPVHEVSQGIDDIQSQVLAQLELILRRALILIGFFLLGTYQPVNFLTPSIVWNVAYVVGVAWATCTLIQCVSFILSDRANYLSYEVAVDEEQILFEREPIDEDMNIVERSAVSSDLVDDESEDESDVAKEEVKESPDDRLDNFDKDRDATLPVPGGRRSTRSSIFNRKQNRMTEGRKFRLDSAEVKSPDEKYAKRDEIVADINGAGSKMPKQHHPELEDLCVMNLKTGERVIVGEPSKIENEHFSGDFLLLCRTSDADTKVEPEITGGSDVNDIRSNYFRQKQRRFELQFQLKFKKAPPSRLYFGCQLEDPVKLGIVQKCFVGATLNFIEKKNNGGFVFNVPGKEPKPNEYKNGNYEKPHLTFAIEKAFDRIVETKEGDTPPTLGTDIYEDPELKKRREKTEYSYNTTSTYTFALWSAYGDFTRWKCVNLPAIRPFSFGSLILGQSIALHVYYLNAPEGETRHMECHQTRIASYELSHAKFSKTTQAKKDWINKYNRKPLDDLQGQNDLIIQDSSIPLDDKSVSDDSDASSDSDGSDSDGDIAEEHVSFDDDEDTRALEDLGEGMYLKYGEPIELQEANINGINALLTNGGGFATLQRDKGATIVFEKVCRRSRRHAKTRVTEPSLIKNGDTVMIKLVDQFEPRGYLSIHKGWWLKWVQRVPRNSGFFVIHTHDIEGIDSASDEFMRSTHSQPLGIETQSSYLIVGGTFHLRAKGSGRQVGVRVNNSAKFGGRVLGLYKSGSYYVAENELGQEPSRVLSENSSRQMMTPLKLCACIPPFTDNVASEGGASLLNDCLANRSQPVPIGEFEDFNIDSPAWLEIMHRSKRSVFRVYAVRIMRSASFHNDISTSTNDHILRLRTGKDLTPVLRFGASVGTRRFQDVSSEEEADLGRTGEMQYDLSPMYSGSNPTSPMDLNLAASNDIDPSDSESSIEDKNDFQTGHMVETGLSQLSKDEVSDSDTIGPISPRSPASVGRKKKKWIHHTTYGITKVAKGVKTGTLKSGTMIGKAVTHTIKGGQRRTYLKDRPRKSKGNRKGKDHHVAVNKALKTVRSPSGRRASLKSLQTPNAIMAGQLKAPDQSCRTVSCILKNMSTTQSLRAKPLLSAQFSTPSDIDMSFLSGGPVELGVDVVSVGNGVALGEYIVARALWDSHWREEASIIYESSIDFYAPLSNKVHLSIPFYDIQRVRRVDKGVHPLPGFPLLAIETSWKCHYLAFKTNEIRFGFLEVINKAIFADSEDMSTRDEWKARMWQSVQSSADSSGESEKWASIISSKKRKQRIVLNSRRMPFDCDEFSFEKRDNNLFQQNLCSFVENLLQKALSFSLENLISNPKGFVSFLDETSRLRTFPLRSIDTSGKGALCIYANLYHCLLQHALLLATGGPPTKKNVAHFMRTHCYEIDGDIFSLAELENCVIRGNLPSPYYPKPPFVTAPKKSRGYLAYALKNVDPRLCFVLNNGNKINSPLIPILKTKSLDKQLDSITSRVLNNSVKVDLTKNSVTLPKVCDVYRNDFDERDSVKFCRRFVNKEKQAMLLEATLSVFTIKYENCSGQFYANLMLLNDGENTLDRDRCE